MYRDGVPHYLSGQDFSDKSQCGMWPCGRLFATNPAPISHLMLEFTSPWERRMGYALSSPKRQTLQ